MPQEQVRAVQGCVCTAAVLHVLHCMSLTSVMAPAEQDLRAVCRASSSPCPHLCCGVLLAEARRSVISYMPAIAAVVVVMAALPAPLCVCERILVEVLAFVCITQHTNTNHHLLVGTVEMRQRTCGQCLPSPANLGTPSSLGNSAPRESTH
jgi:hypothetical protein